MNKLSLLETEVDKLVTFVEFLKNKIRSLEEEKQRLFDRIKYIEEDGRKDKKSIKDIGAGLEQLKEARGRLAELMDKWNSMSSNWVQ